ncbi:MAG: sugar phosphate isomerase/epimerase family protein [Beutenbergiaceae bacterium]
MIDARVACSSITFRHRSLAEAVRLITAAGFQSMDLGALPGVCDHVPYDLTAPALNQVAATIENVAVASINADIGDLNLPLDTIDQQARAGHLDRLLDLCQAVQSPALVLPCGSQGHEPIASVEADLDLVADQLRQAGEQAHARGRQLWVEALHSGRLSYNLERARMLMERLADTAVGVVMDFSHIVASGETIAAFTQALGQRVRHVHLRDAEPGNIHLSIGNGAVDFADGIAGLQAGGYQGRYSLELETHDVEEAQRPAAAVNAATFVTGLL